MNVLHFKLLRNYVYLAIWTTGYAGMRPWKIFKKGGIILFHS